MKCAKNGDTTEIKTGRICRFHIGRRISYRMGTTNARKKKIIVSWVVAYTLLLVEICGSVTNVWNKLVHLLEEMVFAPGAEFSLQRASSIRSPGPVCEEEQAITVHDLMESKEPQMRCGVIVTEMNKKELTKLRSETSGTSGFKLKEKKGFSKYGTNMRR